MSVEWRQNQFFILRALRIGKTPKEIASALHVTPGAVRMTLHRLYRQYNVSNKDELLAKFFDQTDDADEQR